MTGISACGHARDRHARPQPNRCKNPSVIIIAGKIQLYPPELYQRGMEIVTVPTVRNLHSALNPALSRSIT